MQVLEFLALLLTLLSTLHLQDVEVSRRTSNLELCLRGRWLKAPVHKKKASLLILALHVPLAPESKDREAGVGD